MPLDGTLDRMCRSASDGVAADLQLLDAIGAQVDTLIDSLVRGGAMKRTVRRWLIGHAEPPDDDDALTCLMGMAADLELFTPSPSGRTPVDRHVTAARPRTPEERQALDALAAAQFRLVSFTDREGPDVVGVTDLVTGERLLVLDRRISPLASGLATAMRLCPLASGRHCLISPLFAIDEAMLAAAMKFVRPRRPLGAGYRCAANLYRDVARRGVSPMPRLALDEETLLDVLREGVEEMSAVEILAIRWISGGESEADFILEARRMASVDTLVDACGWSARTDPDAPEGLIAAFARIAELQMETIVQRARAGLAGQAEALDLAAAAIAGHIASGKMERAAGDLFGRLRARWTFSASARPAGNAVAGAAELDRVIQRIQALRAKTVDRGCTEEEAMAAAAKVAELLDRHDLTLDEVAVRNSPCEGVGVETGRRRRAPVDGCIESVADFCDCRVWSEESDGGALRYIFFGLKADVEAARFLHGLIEAAFETESAAFRGGQIYRKLHGGERRAAVNAFQVGMASGVRGKLASLKTARRRAREAKTTGFDLVAVKQSTVEEEMAKLGLAFTARAARSRRRVRADAYVAGKTAGWLFEPEAALAR